MKKQILISFTILFMTITIGVFGQTMQQGILLFKNNSYEKAEYVFKRMMQRDSNALAAYYLGRIELERENDSLARYYFNRSITIDKRNPYGYVGIGKLYLDYNKPDSAAKQFDKALKFSNAKDADLLCEIADQYIATGTDSASARHYIERVLSENPGSERATLLFGDWFLNYKNDGNNAIKYYNKAYAVSSTSPDVNLRLGDLYARTSNLELSKQYYLDALKADSSYSIPYLRTGNLLYRMKKYKVAKAYFEKYIALSEASPTIMLRYAFSLFIAKDYANAVEVLSEIKQPGKINISYQRLSGYAYYEIEEYDSCIKAIRNIINNYPPNKITAMDYEYLGKALQNLDEDSLAILRFGQAIEKDTTKSYLYKNIGDIYYNDKNYKDAITQYIKLIESSEIKSAANYYLLGKSYYYNKNYEKADSAFEVVSSISPSYAFVYAYRARCNNQNPDSNHVKAKEYYEKFIALSDNADESSLTFFNEAYFNLAYYAILENDVYSAKKYYDSILRLDPGNKSAIKYLNEIKRNESYQKRH